MFAVTGCNGFVGHHLCSELKKLELPFRGIQRDEVKGYFQIKEINASTDWSNVLKGVEVIFHCAGRAHKLNDKNLDPVSAFREVNVKGTRRLAEQAAKLGVSKFIFLSSIKVNGEITNRLNSPFDEQSPVQPSDAYAISKLEAEKALLTVSRETGLKIVIVRPPLIYGPGVQANFLRLLNVVNKQIPLPFGAIHNQRSLLFVGNLVDFLIVCAQTSMADNETFLVSDGPPLSTTNLILSLSKSLRKTPNLITVRPKILNLLAYLFGRKDDMNRLTSSLIIDSSHAISRLNWSPPFSTEYGIEKTVEWYLECKSKYISSKS